MREQTILLSSSPSDQEKLLQASEKIIHYLCKSSGLDIFFSLPTQGLPPTNRVFKLVLTGGPCGGKTTAQSKLATFFESVGWKASKLH